VNIIIPSVQVPFIKGGADFMVVNLKTALQKSGHKVEVVAIPFKFFPTDYIKANMEYWSKLDFSSFNGIEIDKVIVLQFPAYYANHPDKTLWLMHQHRMAYDLFYSQKASEDEKDLKNYIESMDNRYISDIKRKFAISKNVADRLQRFNNINSTPLYHPPHDENKFYCDQVENYIFFPSRLEYLKRQELVIRAFKFVKSPIKLYLAGEGSHYNDYKKLIEELNLQHKVKLLGRVSQDDKIKLYANSLGVVFPPQDEDYGYVTLEGMLSKKPIITCKDSGGVLEFVEDGINGFITEPTPQHIAEKIEWLYSHKKEAVSLGQNGYDLYKSKNISWDNVVSTLLGLK